MSIWTAVLSSIVLCLRHVFDRWIHGTMFHRVLARILYFSSIAKMSARSRWKPNSAKQWYNRIDETVILGALPFRSQTKEVKKREGVAPPSHYLVSAPDPTLRSSGWITSRSRSGDVIHPLLRNFGSGAETTRARARVCVYTVP